MALNLREINKRLDNPVTLEIMNEITAKGYLDAEELEERLIDTGSVLNTGRYTIPDYLKAVEFTSYRIAEDSQVTAYKKTFPERCMGKTDGAIAGKASIYAHGKMVVQMVGIAQVPLRLLYMRERHRSIRKLAYLVDNAETERVQMESADKLLGHLPDPDEVKVELDMGLGATEVIEDFNQTLNRIADMASKKLESGTINAKELIQR